MSIKYTYYIAILSNLYMYAFVVAYNETVILHEFILVSEAVGEDVELI